MPKWRLESTSETREKIERLREYDEYDSELGRYGEFGRYGYLESREDQSIFRDTDSNLESYRNGNTTEEGPHGFEDLLNDEENSQDISELLERFYIIQDKYDEELRKYEVAAGILKEKGKEVQESDFGDTYVFYEFEFDPSSETLSVIEERLSRLVVEREKLEEQVRELEEQAKREKDEQAKREAEEKARREAEEQARREAEEQAKREAEEQARREAEEQAKRQAEEQARKEAEEQARREVEESARREAEESARREAEEQARREAEEQERRAAEERTRQAEAQEKIRQEEELKAFMEEIAQKAEQERIKREERLKNPYGAIVEDIQALREMQNEAGKKELQETICRTALICFLNENGISTTYGRINDKENAEMFQALKNGFVDRNSESLCELLNKADSLSKDRILTGVKIKVLDDQIMLWKKYGVISIEGNPFMQEFSVKDMEFIIAKFDFNLYENYDDFKRQYTSFCELIKAGCGKDSNHNEALRVYFEQRFGSETEFYKLLNDETKLRSVYEKGAISFTDILERVDKEKAEQGIDENQQASTTQEMEEELGTEQSQEQTQSEEELGTEQSQEQTQSKEELGTEQLQEQTQSEEQLETQKNNNEVPKESITPKHMQSNWHMRSIEEMENSAGISHKEDRNYQNNREVNEDNWMSRFKNWYKQSDRVPINERYSISESMVKAVKEMNDPRITQEAQYEH